MFADTGAIFVPSLSKSESDNILVGIFIQDSGWLARNYFKKSVQLNL